MSTSSVVKRTRTIPVFHEHELRRPLIEVPRCPAGHGPMVPVPAPVNALRCERCGHEVSALSHLAATKQARAVQANRRDVAPVRVPVTDRTVRRFITTPTGLEKEVTWS